MASRSVYWILFSFLLLRILQNLCYIFLVNQVQQEILAKRQSDKKATLNATKKLRKGVKESLQAAKSANEDDFDVTAEDVISGRVPIDAIPQGRDRSKGQVNGRRRAKVGFFFRLLSFCFGFICWPVVGLAMESPSQGKAHQHYFHHCSRLVGRQVRFWWQEAQQQEQHPEINQRHVVFLAGQDETAIQGRQGFGRCRQGWQRRQAPKAWQSAKGTGQGWAGVMLGWHLG